MSPEELRLSHSESTTNANLWDAVSNHSWTPPTALTNYELNKIIDEPRIWLSRAVDVMAFGGETTPIHLIGTIAKRRQATRALFGACRLQHLKLIGNPGSHGDKGEPIPAEYFDIARDLGHDDDAIETDLNCDIKVFVEARTGHHRRWSKVRVDDAPSFVRWLREQLSGNSPNRDVPTYESGVPGRPTSMHLVRTEFEDRFKRGDSAESITKEAAALAKWLLQAHPKAAPATQQTIRNRLSAEFRQRRSLAQN